MKVIVVSDSHGHDQIIEQIKKKHFDANYFIHCGDIGHCSKHYPGFLIVRGNNDNAFYPEIIIIKIESYRILVIHGHQYNSQNRIKKLIALAKENNCEIVLFGHSHLIFNQTIDGIQILNPGALWRNIGSNGATYLILNLTKNDKTITLVNHIS